MRNTIISSLIIVILILAVIFLWPKSPSDNLPEANLSDSVVQIESNIEEKILNQSEAPKINLEIIGYGPGKSHSGTFTEYEIANFKIDENGIPGSGKITIQSKSLDFQIDGLNKHLCANDFLDCEIYPEISFNLTNFLQESENPNQYTAVGTLVFKNNVSVISFPVIKNDNNWSADFRLNVKNLGVSYIGIDEEVQIKFNTI